MTGNITISLRSAFDNFADPNLFIEAKNNNFPVQIKSNITHFCKPQKNFYFEYKSIEIQIFKCKNGVTEITSYKLKKIKILLS